MLQHTSIVQHLQTFSERTILEIAKRKNHRKNRWKEYQTKLKVGELISFTKIQIPKDSKGGNV